MILIGNFPNKHLISFHSTFHPSLCKKRQGSIRSGSRSVGLSESGPSVIEGILVGRRDYGVRGECSKFVILKLREPIAIIIMCPSVGRSFKLLLF